MKKIFDEPTWEIVMFTTQDIISTSVSDEPPTIENGIAN